MQRIFAALLITAILSGSASAGEISDKASQAEALAADGKSVEAIEALEQATNSLWVRLPQLSFRKVLWIEAGHSALRGFGAYIRRETNVYRADEEMIAYAEPVGFAWRKMRDDKRNDDIWQSDFAADITIKTKDGKHLHSQKDIGKGGTAIRSRSHEYGIRVTVTMSNIPAGEYMAEFTVRDAVSGKSGRFSLPFVVISS
jgi:hypothetical protein